MSRRLTASALFALGLLALTAAGQPPEKKPADKKAADPVDALIAAALANDPEVRIARAKVMLADAELAKARQLVAQKVMTLRAAIEEQRSVVKLAEATYALMEQRMKAGAAPQSEILEARAKLEMAKAKLAQLETELKLITGGDRPGEGSAPPTADDLAQVFDRELRYRMALDLVQKANDRPPPAGPVPDRIRGALDKKVTLGPKGQDVTFEKALEVFKKDAGLDVSVRMLMKLTPIKSEGEELPVGAWLQMFADFNAPAVILVREYGLLVTVQPMGIPPDAPTVTEFWKSKPAGKPDSKGPTASGGFRGGSFTLNPEGAEELARAAVRLVRFSSGSDKVAFDPKEWEAAQRRDHVRVVLPNPAEFGFDDREPIEVLIGLSHFPAGYPDIWVKGAGNDVTKFQNPDAGAVKQCNEALRKHTPVR